MAIILNIETATDICSVTISKNGELLASRETNLPNSHSTVLGSYIEEVFSESGFSASSLDAVGVSSGPGSYTGLRIGVSMAKGICFSLDIPLIAVPTLESMVYGVINNYSQFDYFIPMIDAGRMEVYSAVFNRQLNKLMPETPTIIDSESFNSWLQNSKVLMFGNGSLKCKNTIISPNLSFCDEGLPSATAMISPAYQRFLNNDFVSTAYFEPFYLKEFQAKISKVKGLD